MFCRCPPCGWPMATCPLSLLGMGRLQGACPGVRVGPGVGKEEGRWEVPWRGCPHPGCEPGGGSWQRGCMAEALGKWTSSLAAVAPHAGPLGCRLILRVLGSQGGLWTVSSLLRPV